MKMNGTFDEMTTKVRSAFSANPRRAKAALWSIIALAFLALLIPAVGSFRKDGSAASGAGARQAAIAAERDAELTTLAAQLDKPGPRSGEIAYRILDRATEYHAVHSRESTPPFEDAVLRAAEFLVSGKSDGSSRNLVAYGQARGALPLLSEPQKRVSLILRMVAFDEATPGGIQRTYKLLSKFQNDVEQLEPAEKDDPITSMVSYFIRNTGRNTLATAFLLTEEMTDPDRRAKLYHEIALKRLQRQSADRKLAASLAAGKQDTSLVKASWKTMQQQRPQEAMLLAMAIDKADTRDRMLAYLASRVIDTERISSIRPALLAISDARLRDDKLLDYTFAADRLQFAHHAARSLAAIIDPDKRIVGSSLLAESFAQSGYRLRADAYLPTLNAIRNMSVEGSRDAAAANAAKANAALGRLDQAVDALQLISHSGDLRSDAAFIVGRALFSKQSNASKIANVAEQADGRIKAQIMAFAAIQSARAGRLDDVDSLIESIRDAETRITARAHVALALDMPPQWINRARAELAALAPGKYDADAAYAAFNVALGEYGHARQRLRRASEKQMIRDVGEVLARRLAQQGRGNEAISLTALLDEKDSDGKDTFVRSAAIGLAAGGDIEHAVETARSMTNLVRRVQTFRRLAMMEAKRNDLHDALNGEPQPLPRTVNNPEDASPVLKRASFHIFDIRQNELGEQIPRLPNAASYNARNVFGKVPEPGGAQVQIAPLANNGYNKKFLTARNFTNVGFGGPSVVMEAQGTSYPIYIHVDSGVIDLPTLHEQLALMGRPDLLQREGRIYTLRVPLFVSTNAALIIAGSDVKQLRLSTERAAYLVSAGRVFFTGVGVVGWSEKNDAPAELSEETKGDFRPFYVGWSNSVTQAAHSRFSNLGHNSGKAYGFTFSAGPLGVMSQVRESRNPTGTVIDNSFENMLYGFYSYEASHVALVGNEYRDNLVYGIDPHDRSHDLLIAYNTAYGSKKKHGIIGSRNVENSWFVGNLAFDNHGSGMMMDRFSGRNVIYANTSFGNHGHGIAIYESPCNIVSGNRLFGNHGNGVVFRNSWNVGIFDNRISDNHKYGIGGYAVEFVVKPGAPTRNLVLDPYEKFISGSVVGNTVSRNASGGISMKGMGATAIRENQITGPAGRAYLGDLRVVEADVARDSLEGLIIGGSCPTPKMVYACPFAQRGYLSAELSSAAQAQPRFQTCPETTTVNHETVAQAQTPTRPAPEKVSAPGKQARTAKVAAPRLADASGSLSAKEIP